MDAREYCFGPFRLNADTGELFRDGELVPLEPRPTRILVRLVEKAGRMVSRQELRELGWPRLPGAAEESLNTCIRQIRRALGDDVSDARFVETLRGRGYRFLAAVTLRQAHPVTRFVPEQKSTPGVRARLPTSSRQPRPAATVAAAAALVLVTVLGLASARIIALQDPAPIRVIVEPVDVSPDIPHADVFGRALADEMRAALAVVSPGRLQVLGRASTQRILEADGEAGWAELGVTHRLALTVHEPEEGMLRVVARVVGVGTDAVRWGGAVDATPRTLGRATSSLAADIVGNLGVPAVTSLLPGMDVPLDLRRGLMKSRFLFESHGDLDLALATVDSVLALQPGLADAHGLRAEVLLRLGMPAEARAAASETLKLDPFHAAGLRAAAGVQMLDGAWAEAEASLSRALSRQPNDPPTLTALAFLLTVRGRFAEAEHALERALRTDPLAPVLVGDAGLMHLWAGRFDRAARTCRETLQLDPDAVWALGCAFDALSRAGRADEAADAGRAILERYDVAGRPGPDAPDSAVLERVRQWRIEAWEAAVRSGDPPYHLAVAYADAGRVADALRYLEDATEHPSMAVLSMAVEPRLRPLTDDRKFRSLLRRLNLAGVPGQS